MASESQATGGLYIIAAPSGAGKTSLIRELIATTSSLELSVSHTTRAPRPGEEDGVHYHFVDPAEFRSSIGRGVFFEYAQVFDNFYGTSREAVQARTDTGVDVILEIDWQGARQIRALMPEVTSVFILPPSLEALRQRLRLRAQDSDEVIERRMRDAVGEVSHYEEFDYLIVNDDFDRALAALRAIIVAHRQRRQVQIPRLAPLLDSLLT